LFVFAAIFGALAAMGAGCGHGYFLYFLRHRRGIRCVRGWGSDGGKDCVRCSQRPSAQGLGAACGSCRMGNNRARSRSAYEQRNGEPVDSHAVHARLVRCHGHLPRSPREGYGGGLRGR
jgi:hypothetical protein